MNSCFDFQTFRHNISQAYLNIMTPNLLRSALVLSCIFLLSSCSLFNKKGTGAGGSGSDSDTVGGTPLPERQNGVSFMSDNVDKHQFPPVHFAFDSYSIDSSDEGTLQAVAQFLQSKPNSIIIAGFTDERGTPEYNRGLGESRAEAVRDYLLHHGADAGKSRPSALARKCPLTPLQMKMHGQKIAARNLVSSNEPEPRGKLTA